MRSLLVVFCLVAILFSVEAKKLSLPKVNFGKQHVKGASDIVFQAYSLVQMPIKIIACTYVIPQLVGTMNLSVTAPKTLKSETKVGSHRFQHTQSTQNQQKRESIIDLAPLVDTKIRVKFVGGREIVGVLKGADPICNMVLDDTIEFLRDAKDQYNLTEQTRELGFLVARGTTVLSICSEEGAQTNIENPYAVQE
ncbi:u6 snrna-associated sm-like protein lsm7 [Stylonychia lemnae]|uniref:U6 snrna-associated sm-like protein lsm7 n=1 Tax=Stylonychia lemnae TaxID=5949 RepID=A0A078AYK2_STYLE|nr:u6 snrna-associated sm-like protein lsm7 [Stylonychia lemnae]|eukprot:CDW87211.1 u6 snrna-associated sm-like protein lsm7 [Stylonychia lemnae]